MNTYTRSVAPLVLLAGSAVAAPAFAQMYRSPATRPVQWFIDVGGSITQGAAGQDFDNGWTLGTGVTFRDPGQPLGLRLDLHYSRSDATNRFISLNEAATGTPIDNGSMQTFTGFVDAVLEAPISPRARFYATAGVGFGYRRIELTQNGFFCDPYFCYSGFGRDVLVASSDTTRFAWNAGAGVNFALPGGQAWFIEARYERIETTPQSTEFVPIRIGYRF